jgi:hypothetical protein
LDALLVGRHPTARLEQLFYKNPAPDWIKLGIFDARRLLELGASLGLYGDKLWAGALGCEVAANRAGLEQFEVIVLLVHRDKTSSVTIGVTDSKRNDAQLCREPGRKAGARCMTAAFARPS